MSLSLAHLLNRNGLFALKGGVHPEGRKFLTAETPIESMPLPSLIRLPLRQHIGAQAEPLVKRGDAVVKGQLIASARSTVSANVHAPTSGQVIAVGFFTAPHPSGLPVPTVTIRPDGQDSWGPRLARMHPEDATAPELATRAAEAGIVGMGGAGFPAAVKLHLGQKFDLDTLIINGAECEPYLTCDDRLMREHAEEIVDGAAIMAKALGVKRLIFGVEANKAAAIAALSGYRNVLGYHIDIRVLPTQYPMGSGNHLVKIITGRETPARALSAELGVVVHNVATAYAMHLAVRYGEPSLHRVVTVSGRGVKEPRNLRVLIGTPIKEILDHCGGLIGDQTQLVMGGPMMGFPVQSLRIPAIKSTSGILALTKAERRKSDAMPCIRCGSCVQACPAGLTPFEMNTRIQAENLDGAVEVGLMDCIACGCCTYACPSNIPLVQGFSYAKGRLAEKQSQDHQREETKRLAAARTAREEAIAAAKREAMAKRKAQMAEKKRKEAEAKAAQAANEEAAQ
ncbi:electron transport complex subunit RsxC [Cognatiyoonia sp. IB215182]|uniref:electron transport complex subunit RsxC n=1 Tax=Cognatiyoonia sp. IB215182 TaxID=3097353 RepID=UPI002A0BF32B|nr:electron transport complex subunit RsxC [Cognatiyoonia sp. IB215182]MDX8355427.1 electron transport complex subunit RsxC [Cognatiyoonia sp. IB215182]